MEIIIGKTAGFCFGVKNAVENTIKELEKKEETYCLGELVHNKQVTEELCANGARFIENIDEAKNKIIIRAHGVTKDIYEKAGKLNLKIKDLTCPKVLKIHSIAEVYSNKDYFTFLIGQKEHPETIGTASFCTSGLAIIEKIEDIEKSMQIYYKSNKKQALVIAQTTYSLEKFNIVVEELKKHIEELEVKNTICNATKTRQLETEKIAKQVDAMIIVGGKHSSNSNKLYEIAKKYCKQVLFIEKKEELKIERIKNAQVLGIMAGASTPQKSIQEIVDIIKNI